MYSLLQNLYQNVDRQGKFPSFMFSSNFEEAIKTMFSGEY